MDVGDLLASVTVGIGDRHCLQPDRLRRGVGLIDADGEKRRRQETHRISHRVRLVFLCGGRCGNPGRNDGSECHQRWSYAGTTIEFDAHISLPHFEDDLVCFG